MAISAAKDLPTLLQQAGRGLNFADASARILATAPHPQPETLPLHQAAGRVLCVPVIAGRDQPPQAVSAMDGYALRHADLPNKTLKVEGLNAAGQDAGPPLAPHTARRIFTGAPLPGGANTVLMQEAASLDQPQRLRPLEHPAKGAFVRPQGFDFSAGATLLPAGQVLTPAALGLAAAANMATLEVAIRPKVALLSTGDELRAPGQARAGQDVVASNGPMLAALLDQAGAEVWDLGFVGDDIGAICTQLDQAKGADLCLTTGGASVGQFDLVQTALARLGGTPEFWQIMMRPGKPVFLWRLHEHPLLGLPGNPVSAFVCARLLALPWIRSALGMQNIAEARHTFTLGGSLPKNGPRHQFARACLQDGLLVPAQSQDSSLLRTLHLADALIERPPHDPEKTEGEQVKAVLL